jgi:hypothetical protein
MGNANLMQFLKYRNIPYIYKRVTGDSLPSKHSAAFIDTICKFTLQAREVYF